jgi:hypothetical protein
VAVVNSATCLSGFPYLRPSPRILFLFPTLSRHASTILLQAFRLRSYLLATFACMLGTASSTLSGLPACLPACFPAPRFRSYSRLMRERLMPRYNAATHWAKLEVPEGAGEGCAQAVQG